MIKFNMKNIIIMLSLCMITSTIGVVTADCINSGKFVDDVDQKETENIVIDPDNQIIFEENDTKKATYFDSWKNRYLFVVTDPITNEKYYNDILIQGQVKDINGKVVPYPWVVLFVDEKNGETKEYYYQGSYDGYYQFIDDERFKGCSYYIDERISPSSKLSLYYDGDHEYIGAYKPFTLGNGFDK